MSTLYKSPLQSYTNTQNFLLDAGNRYKCKRGEMSTLLHVCCRCGEISAWRNVPRIDVSTMYIFPRNRIENFIRLESVDICMSDDSSHPALDGYEIDDDYIDVEPQRSAINIDEQQRDTPPDERDVRYPNKSPPQNSSGVEDSPESAADDVSLPKTSKNQSVDMSHVFGRMQGDGSQTFGDLQIDARKATERDDRGGETGMDVSDADGYYGEKIIRDGKQRTRAEWLLLLNNGYRSQSRKQDNQSADNQRWIDTFTAQLELTEYQIERVRTIIDSINMARFGTYTVEIIVLAAISLVTQDDDRMVRDERGYKKLLVAANGDFRDIRRVRNLIKEKSPLYEMG